MKKRFLALLPVALLTASLASCSNIKEPTFEETNGVCFTAYAGPTVASGSRINTITDEHYKKLAEAGFNKVLALYEGSIGTGSTAEETLTKRAQQAEKDALPALELAEKYGLKYYVRDWNMYGLSRQSEVSYRQGINCYDKYVEAMKYIFSDENQYVHKAAYAGNFTFDEPSYNEINAIGEVVKAYYERMAELGVTDVQPVVNLLPIYAGQSTLGSHTYSQYVDEYIKKVGRQTGYISYDFYPLVKGDKYGDSYVKTLYLMNLQMMAEKCRENNLELRTFIQDIGDYTGIRDMKSTADIRFQVYANMAFGSANMTYYEYGNAHSAVDGNFGLLNLSDGTYNWTYNCVKTVNNEVHNFEDAYLAYEYDDVSYMSADLTYENQNFLNLTHSVESFPGAAIKKVDQDTLLTSFKNKKDGSPAYMIVNFSDPYNQATDTVTVKFKDAKALLMYRLGQKMIVNLPMSKEYTFKLGGGEGRFIIPLS